MKTNTKNQQVMIEETERPGFFSSLGTTLFLVSNLIFLLVAYILTKRN